MNIVNLEILFLSFRIDDLNPEDEINNEVILRVEDEPR